MLNITSNQTGVFLSDTQFVTAGRILNLSNLDNITLTGSATTTQAFYITGRPTGSTLTVNGVSGTDRIEVTTSAKWVDVNDNYIIADRRILLQNIDEARITGDSANQTFNLSDWSGGGSINGVSGTDTIILSKDADMTLSTGSLTSYLFNTWSLSNIDKAILKGGASANRIDASSFVGQVTIQGGAGNDKIWGGISSAVLSGGAGHDFVVGGINADIINGNSGRDVLIGRGGADILNGGTNQNILIGGTTHYDSSSNANNVSIDAIMTAWTSGTEDLLGYLARITLLNQTGVGTGNLVKLKISTPSSPGSTVLNDSAVDTLTGGGGLDWFIANLVTPGAGLDVANNTTNEQVLELI
jgi:Ca2+-binding RTX toxin-like protein